MNRQEVSSGQTGQFATDYGRGWRL
jgi:hypothetical protein